MGHYRHPVENDRLAPTKAVEAKTFRAKYRSRCPECRWPILPGDDACYDGSLVVHAACAIAARRRNNP